MYQTQPMYQTQQVHQMQSLGPLNMIQPQQSYSQHNQQRIVNSPPLIVQSQPPNYTVHQSHYQETQPHQINPYPVNSMQRLQKSSTNHRYEQKYIQLFEKFVWYTERHEYFTR